MRDYLLMGATVVGLVLFLVGLVWIFGWLDAKEKAEELARDMKTFRDNVTDADLEEIARSVSKPIRNLRSLTVSQHVFYGTATTQSGLNNWHFKLDFDCRGHLSTQCKVERENKDSKIPAVVESRIREQIELYNAGRRPERPKAQAKQASPAGAAAFGGGAKSRAAFCPYCGQKALDGGAVYCAACGKKLPMV